MKLQHLDELPVAEQMEYEKWAVATAQQAFEQRKWTVLCRICRIHDCDTEQHLSEKQWRLTRSGEFCPSH